MDQNKVSHCLRPLGKNGLRPRKTTTTGPVWVPRPISLAWFQGQQLPYRVCIGFFASCTAGFVVLGRPKYDFWLYSVLRVFSDCGLLHVLQSETGIQIPRMGQGRGCIHHSRERSWAYGCEQELLASFKTQECMIKCYQDLSLTYSQGSKSSQRVQVEEECQRQCYYDLCVSLRMPDKGGAATTRMADASMRMTAMKMFLQDHQVCCATVG